MSAPIEIALSPPDGPAASVSALERACSSATHGAVCTVRSGSASASGPTVRVAWTDSARSGAIVRVNGPRGVRERTLTFAAGDADLERWRAVGFAVATLVDETAEEPSAAPPPGSAASPAPPTPPPPEPVAPAPREITIVGNSTVTAVPVFPREPRAAPFVSASLALTPTVGGHLAAGPELRSGAGVDARTAITWAFGNTVLGGSQGRLSSSLLWISGGARTALWRDRHVLLNARIEVFAEQLRLGATSGAYSDNAGSWLPGGRAGIDVELRLGAVSPTLGLEMGGRAGTTTIVVARQESGALSAWRPAAALGAIVEF